MKLKLALLATLTLAGANAMACYTVFDASNRVIHQSVEAPVDMSQPLHNALARRFPAGSSMVFNQGASCTPVSLAQVSRPATGDVPVNTIRMERSGKTSPSSSSPLFTDRDTAQRQHLPHTVVAGNIVMVPASAAGRAIIPSLTVIPADTALARAPAGPDTRMMGGAPAARSNVVITEMRDPPMTITQNGTIYSVQRN